MPQIRKRVFLIGIRKDINYDVEKIFEDINKTHYVPNSTKLEKLNKKKYVTVKDAIVDLPKLKPGQGKIETKFKSKLKNEYIKNL